MTCAVPGEFVKALIAQGWRNLGSNVGSQSAAAFSLQRLSGWETLGHREVGSIAEGHQTGESMKNTKLGAIEMLEAFVQAGYSGDGLNLVTGLVVTLGVLLSATLLHPFNSSTLGERKGQRGKAMMSLLDYVLLSRSIKFLGETLIFAVRRSNLFFLLFLLHAQLLNKS